MFRIGEFSKLTQVSIRMLRYYDEVGLLKPAQTDSYTGYRFYSVEQIPTLNKILFLRDIGLHVEEIAITLNNWNQEFLMEQFKRKQEDIEKTIKQEQDKIEKIELAKKEIMQKKNEMQYNIIIKSIPSAPVFSLRKIIPDYYAEGELWKEMSVFAEKNKIAISKNPTFSIYHDVEYKEKDVDVELCVSVEKIGRDREGFTYRYIEEVPIMACTMVYGGFENIKDVYLCFAKWLQKNSQYKMTGQSRQIVHRGPWNEKNPEQYLIEIQIVLEDTKNKK